MLLLSLDLGEKRVGVAISRSKILAEPLATLNFDQNFFNQLGRICQEEKIEKIIIGLPKSFGEKESEQEKKIKRFAQEIKNKLNWRGK